MIAPSPLAITGASDQYVSAAPSSELFSLAGRSGEDE